MTPRPGASILRYMNAATAATAKTPTAAQRATYESLMAVNERGLTPSALERHKRAWKKLEAALAARGCTLVDLY